MSAEVSIGDKRLNPHPLRAAILGEVHARPFTRDRDARPHPAFRLRHRRRSGERRPRGADRLLRAARPRPAAARPPSIIASTFGGTVLRWEQHSEFTTYTWELPADRRGHAVSSGRVIARLADGAACRSRARCWSRVDLHLMRRPAEIASQIEQPVRPRQPRGGRELRRHRDLRHRLPARSGRLRAHPGARPRPWRRSAPARWCSA